MLFIKGSCLEELMCKTYQIQRYNKLIGDIQKKTNKNIGQTKQLPHIGRYPNY